MAWRGSTTAWSGTPRPPDLKIQYPGNTADVVIIDEPVMQSFGTRTDGSPDERFHLKVGYLDGVNALAGMYDREKKEKYEVSAEIGTLYTLWMGKSLIQALVNLWPDEDEPMVGKVIRVGRVKVVGGRFGGFLGYTAEELTAYNTALVDRLFEIASAEESKELDEPEKIEAGSEDLEIAFQLVNTSLQALGEMSYPQLENFLKSRRSAGLMKIELNAQEVANYCVSKDPAKFEIAVDGESKSLVLK